MPRLNLFRDDPIVWRTYGLAISIFVFSLTAMLAIGNYPEVPVILPVAEGVAVLAVIALIRAVLVKAFASIQLAPVLSAIAPRLPPLHWTVTWPGQQAVLQELDLPRLLGASSPP